MAGVTLPVGALLTLGVLSAEGRSNYEVIKDLFLPLVGPLVAVLIPVIILFVIPFNQTRQRLSLELCGQYFSEEMRDARNTAWRVFVTEQRKLPPIRRAERLNHFLDYLLTPDTHRGVDPGTDADYQKTSRVLDFFALVNGCLARGVADREMVRDFLLFYYIWWRDEIMDPLRRTHRGHAGQVRFRPTWWAPLGHLDALAARMAPGGGRTAESGLTRGL